jgi:hypothetical protein
VLHSRRQETLYSRLSGTQISQNGKKLAETKKWEFLILCNCGSTCNAFRIWGVFVKEALLIFVLCSSQDDVTYVGNIVRSPGSQNLHKSERLLASGAHVLWIWTYSYMLRILMKIALNWSCFYFGHPLVYTIPDSNFMFVIMK